MKKAEKYLLSTKEMDLINAAYQKAVEMAKDRLAKDYGRRERDLEAIYHGDTPTFMELPLARRSCELKGADTVILGIPYEGITIKTPTLAAPPTVSRPEPGSVYWRMGSDKAPDSIRKCSLYYSVRHKLGIFPEIDKDLVLSEHLNIFDYGDVEVVPQDTDETVRRAFEKVSDIVKAGAVPIVFGGDHTIPYPVLKAVLEPRNKKIGLVIFDSHMDFSYEPAVWASSEWFRTMELGKISPKNMVEIGIRGRRNSILERNVADILGIQVFDIEEVQTLGIREVMRQAIKIAGGGTDGIYISLDIDVMEPGLVPAQKAPEFWGLTSDEMIPALRTLAKEKVAGLDICELTPDYDINGMGAQFVARCAVEVLAGMAVRKRDSGRKNRIVSSEPKKNGKEKFLS